MEYVILGAIIIAFSSISTQLSSIKNKMDNQIKSKINLKDYVGKKVKIYLDDEYDIELIGELLYYDNKFIVLVWNQVPSISVYKNQLHFSMLTTNLSKIKIKKAILFYSSIKKHKILGNKFNQGGKKKIHLKL